MKCERLFYFLNAMGIMRRWPLPSAMARNVGGAGGLWRRRFFGSRSKFA